LYGGTGENEEISAGNKSKYVQSPGQPSSRLTHQITPGLIIMLPVTNSINFV